ncbi:glycosyl transferase [Flavonifractor sp. An52]|uniref:glycosyltransferase n=1 Tax=Flavonifractor sp. An52 TaxID=1965642 RepID=UPI000B36C7F3|nr:glycosyltransferase [Flavonifractor sp. An52]OUN79907.1 glycosyl transferase [Flavonifractor sp. An52]
MKKVLFLITNLAHGGAERVLVNLANNLDKEKYDVTVQTIFDEGVNRKYLSPNIHYKSVFSRSFHGIKYITAILPAPVLHKLFIKETYDFEIAYLEGPPAKIIGGCTDRNIRLLSWIHIELLSNKVFAEGFRNVREAKKIYQKFSKIVCVSNTVKQCFERISGIYGNVEVLYNTNETEKIRELASEVAEDLDVDDIFTICSVAKIEDSKGYDRLLEVHKRLIDEGYLHKIILIGVGSKSKKLEECAKVYGVSKSFQLIGFRDNPYKYVAKSDLYVCSSRREGFSTAVTEALVLGTPVVSTECSGAKELLGDNDEYGLVVENSTEGIYWGLKRMLQEPGLLDHYTRQAQIRGTYFSREKTVAAVENMLENIE